VTRHPVHDRIIALVLSLGALTLYTFTLAPGVLGGDSGEWQYMMPTIGVAHSTGYPLYVFVGKFFITFLPLGSVAFRVNLFSAVCAAIVVGLVYLLATRMNIRLFLSPAKAQVSNLADIITTRAPSILAALFFMLAPTLWASAVEAEVYALNTLLGVGVFYLSWEWYESRNLRIFLVLSFMLGLALDNHRVIAFLAPGLLVLVWYTRDSLRAKHYAIAAILVLLPLLLYAYIPLRAGQLISQQDPANWELYNREDAFLKGTVSAYYRDSLDGFVNLVLAFDNRSKLGFQSDVPDASLQARSWRALSLALDQFNIVGVLLAFGGAVIWWRREKKLALIFFSLGAGIAFIGFFLRGESTQYYFSLAYVVTDLCVAVALMWLGSRRIVLNRATNQATFLFLPLALLGTLGLVLILSENLGKLDNSHDTRYADYARTVLKDQLLPNSVVIGGWEIVTPIRYYQFVEGERADLLFIHESPVRPQYQKIFSSARALHRPFYYIQFSPEDQNAPGPRYVQAIALPMHESPQPEYVLNEKIVNQVTLVGFNISPAPKPGSMTRVELFYRVDSDINEEFDAEFSVMQIGGREWGHYSHPPVTAYYKTTLWRKDETFRDVWFWEVPPEAPSGEYQAELSWYNLNQNRAETKLDFDFTFGKSSQ
jgi:hypothetical protein